MINRDKAFFGRGMICLLWVGLGLAFILRGPRYVTPIAAYIAGFVFIVLAIVIIVTAISQKRARLRSGSPRKARPDNDERLLPSA